MRHGEGFERAYEALRKRGNATPFSGSPETGIQDGNETPETYPYRLFGSGTKAFDTKDTFLGASKLDLKSATALMARLATTLHLKDAVRKETGDDTGNPAIPAGYTYLAQFAIHDMTFSDPSGTVPGKVTNHSTPALDLGTLYGRTSTAADLLFEESGPFKARTRFRIGYTVAGPAEKGWAANGQIWKRGRQEDIPRMPLGPACGHTDERNVHEPLLCDTRNADNQILSQLTLLFMKFHNKVLDRAAVKLKDKSSEAFELTRSIVTQVYRRILKQDLLEKILDDPTWRRYFDPAAPKAQTGSKISREAAFAILRFGHAMVRSDYNFSAIQSKAELKTLLDFFGIPADNGMQEHLPLNESWIIDWSLFFNLAGHCPAVNFANRFAPAISGTLQTHPAVRFLDKEELKGLDLGLPFRTLSKGLLHDLPTAQALAAAMKTGLPSLATVSPADIEKSLDPGPGHALFPADLLLTKADLKLLGEHTPLFAYMLIEAELIGKGVKLGPVAGDFVGYTFACGFANGGDLSNLDARWVELGMDKAPPASMPELIIFVQEDSNA